MALFIYPRRIALWGASLLCSGLLALPFQAGAQAGTAKKEKPKVVNVAKAKPAASKTKPESRSARKPAPEPVAKLPETVVHLPLSTAQQAISQTVHVGTIPCELGQVVEVHPMEGQPGFFKLKLGKVTYTVAPEETTTGAVRLEDKVGGVVWLQLANKSMLMNHKLGRRMADECMSPPQLLVAQEMQRNPPRSLLEPLPVAATSSVP